MHQGNRVLSHADVRCSSLHDAIVNRLRFLVIGEVYVDVSTAHGVLLAISASFGHVLNDQIRERGFVIFRC